MKLTQENAASFAGGQLEMRQRDKQLVHRGEVVRIDVQGSTLRVEFTWLARQERSAKDPFWCFDQARPCEVDLDEYVATNIGPCASGGGDRFFLSAAHGEKVVVLFPPDGEKLSPSEVFGFGREL